MKEGWERHKKECLLDLGEINEIIHTFDKHLQVKNCEILSGGLSHTNYRVDFEGDASPLVLRVTQDALTMEMEKNLHSLLTNQTEVRIPTFHFLMQRKDKHVGVLEWKEGRLLKTSLKNGSPEDLFQMGYSLGVQMAAYRKITFDSHGFLDAKLEVTEQLHLTPTVFYETMEYFLKEGKTARWLEGDMTDSLLFFSKTHASFLEEDQSGPSLVHGDFNGLNILMDHTDVTAILDWEFAIAGTIYLDIGNFIRYDEYPNFTEIQKGLIAGLKASGIELSAHWRRLAKLVDLIALCSMLDNDNGGINRVKDINRLIKRTIDTF